MIGGNTLLTLVTADDSEIAVDDYGDRKVLLVNGEAYELTLHEAQQLSEALEE